MIHKKKKEQGRSSSDEIIKKNIERKLAVSKLWNDTAIYAEVDRGKVTLTGLVANKDEMHQAETLTASVDGVKQIVNQLEIKGDRIASIVSEIGSEVSRIISGENPTKETGK